MEVFHFPGSERGAIAAMSILMATETEDWSTDFALENRFRFGSAHPVLTFSFHTDRPYMGKPTFGLDFFGDGRLIARLPENYPSSLVKHYERSIERRGRFELSLEESEIEELFQIAERILGVDDAEADRQIERQRRETPKARSRDGALSSFSIHLSNYRPSAETEWQGAAAKRIIWNSLQYDARTFSGISGLQELAGAQEVLISWALKAAERVEKKEVQR